MILAIATTSLGNVILASMIGILGFLRFRRNNSSV